MSIDPEETEDRDSDLSPATDGAAIDLDTHRGVDIATPTVNTEAGPQPSGEIAVPTSTPTSAPGRSIVPAVAPVIGGFVGGAYAFAVLALSNRFHTAVTHAPIYLAWLSLITAQGVLAGAGGTASWSALSTWWRRCTARERRGAFGVTVLVLGILGCLMFFAPLTFKIEINWPIGNGDEERYNTFLLSLGVSPASFVALMALWLVALAPASARIGEQAVTPAVLRDFLDRREVTRWLVGFLGAQVSVLTLATGTLNRAIVASHYESNETLPPVLALAYGAYFAVGVAAAYLPVHSRLMQLGAELRDELLNKTTDPLEYVAQRKKIAGDLDLEKEFATTYKDFVPIVAPLIAGIVAFALPKD